MTPTTSNHLDLCPGRKMSFHTQIFNQAVNIHDRFPWQQSMQMHGAPPLGAPRKQKISMFSFTTCALSVFKSGIHVVRTPNLLLYWIQAGATDSLFSKPDHTGSGAHQASYSMGTGFLSRGQSSRSVKRTSLPHHINP